jgi:signal transduction histidine kinase/DNA-binding response OmpR family regulator/streptogramin lyase
MSYYIDTLAQVKHVGDKVWVKMNKWGFGYYDRVNDEIVPLSNVKEQEDHIFMNGVACFEADESGVLWMSTVGRGLEKVTIIDPKVEVIVPPTRSDDLKSSSEVRAMLRDSKDNLWVATKSRELYRYSADFSTCVRFPDSSSGDLGVVYSIYEDNLGNIWLGTKGDGLIKMTPRGDSYSWKRFKYNEHDYNSLSSNNIYSIEQDKSGRIWVGTYGGAISMLPTPDSESFVTVRNNFPDYPQDLGDRVRFLHCMPDGRMLVATVGGLILFEPSDTPELTVFTKVMKIPGDINSLGNNDVIHIFTDRQGDTWLSTFGGGLNRIYFENGLPRFDILSTVDGLANNIVHSATDDGNGDIWIATESGISRYDKSTGEITNFSRYDGVRSTFYSEATCSSLNDGSVVFGTYDNIYRFYPEDFTEHDSDPCLVVSGLTVDEVRTPFQDKIVIPHDYSMFRIDFSSLDFSKGGDLPISYRLHGYDKDWIPAMGTNRALYSHVPPGNYTFMIRPTHSADDSQEYTCSVGVRVKASVWNSTASHIVYVLLALLIMSIFVRMIFVQVKLRNDVKLQHDLNDIKVKFFTNISHELRTPLTLILGGIDEIRQKSVKGEHSDYSINVVRKNAKRMLTLVNQLLDIRTIVNGKMSLKVSQFDVVKLVNDVYDDFRDMAAERQMDMRIIKSVDSLVISADSIRMEAIVYNLMSNAFKYTSDGGKIEVGVLYREGDSDFRIMVKDNGIGVPDEKREEIFEPFTRASDTTVKTMSGNGIGLSFCKEIVEMHGGEIWVDSRKGEGSKFFVRLPIDKEGNVEELYGLSKYKVQPTHPENAMKILVVEDNAELRVYIYNSLAGRYEVRDAANGIEAMNVIRGGWIPDMVVTDLMMPQMDGIELVSCLRSDFGTSHIPILMITAKYEDDSHVKAMKYGADGYILKPFTMELLIARIDNMLERRRQLLSTLSVIAETKATGKVDICPEEIVITDKDEELIKTVMAWLEANVMDADVTVEQLAQHVGMGRTSMYNKIKGLTGKSPVELIQEFRLEKSKYYLKSGQFSVSETSYKVGFSDPGYFSRTFKKRFGMTPAEFIKQNKTS